MRKEWLSAHLWKKGSLSEKQSFRLRDYHEYQWGRGERWKVVGISIGVVLLLAYFFYRSVFAVLPLSFTGILAFRYLYAGRLAGQQEELGQQFRECILAVSVTLQSGYAIENAFLESEQDMNLLFGENSFICEELRVIRRGLHINIPLEELLRDFGARSNCEEIVWFAEVFSIAKRNGGNLVEIIRGTAELIGRKLDAKREIAAILSGKRMELAIMEGMPFLFFLYIGLTNPGYFDTLYHNLSGIAIMTGCLIVYLAAFALGERMLRSIGRK